MPDAAVTLEGTSVHCGDNAGKSLAIVKLLGIDADTVLLVQDPTMQRRSHASFEKLWPEHTRFLSYAPFVPRVERIKERWEIVVPRDMRPAWEWERFLDLIQGEIPRLRDDGLGYGPHGRGYIVHVDIPFQIETDARLLARHFPNTRTLQD